MSAPTLSGARQLRNAPVEHSHLANLDGIGTKLLPASPACEPVHGHDVRGGGLDVARQDMHNGNSRTSLSNPRSGASLQRREHATSIAA